MLQFQPIDAKQFQDIGEWISAQVKAPRPYLGGRSLLSFCSSPDIDWGKGLRYHLKSSKTTLPPGDLLQDLCVRLFLGETSIFDQYDPQRGVPFDLFFFHRVIQRAISLRAMQAKKDRKLYLLQQQDAGDGSGAESYAKSNTLDVPDVSLSEKLFDTDFTPKFRRYLLSQAHGRAMASALDLLLSGVSVAELAEELVAAEVPPMSRVPWERGSVRVLLNHLKISFTRFMAANPGLQDIYRGLTDQFKRPARVKPVKKQQRTFFVQVPKEFQEGDTDSREVVVVHQGRYNTRIVFSENLPAYQGMTPKQRQESGLSHVVNTEELRSGRLTRIGSTYVYAY